MIEIIPGIGVSEHELTFTFERSPGPGGQNVNKVNTRVTLRFDVANSMSLTGAQRARVRKALATRVTADGVLRVVSSKERTQLGNRRAAGSRFIELMSGALHIPKRRRKTRVPTSARRARVDTKTQRGALKRSRRSPTSLDD